MGGKAIYRGLGSIDITAAARSIMMLGTKESDPTQKGVAHIKSNIGKTGDIVGFSIAEDGFKWQKTPNITADEIYGNPRSTSEVSALDKACTFLTEVLSEHDRTAKDLHIMATAYNISEGTLRRAKDKLGVKSYKGTENNKIAYFWQLSG